MRNSKRNQSGFTIIELTIVAMVIAVIVAFSFPQLRTFLIGQKTPATAGDIGKVVAGLRVSAAGQGATPYATMSTTAFAKAARDIAPSLTVTDTGAVATVTHELGLAGSAVTAAPATIVAGQVGDGFSVSLATVHNAGCAGFVSGASKYADSISINGTEVKAVGGVLNGMAAQAACTVGDTNTILLTAR